MAVPSVALRAMADSAAPSAFIFLLAVPAVALAKAGGEREIRMPLRPGGYGAQAPYCCIHKICFPRSALPEPVLRYFSNSIAFCSSLNTQYHCNSHGAYFAVYIEPPSLCTCNRLAISIVYPTYSFPDIFSELRMYTKYI